MAPMTKEGKKKNQTSKKQATIKNKKTKCKTFGDRAFAIAGPRVWNSLPLAVRNSVNVDTFKTNLKSFLFTQAYKHII